MKFERERIKEYFLLDTRVENIFISEYMAAAPADFVKVYLMALMFADLEHAAEGENLAKTLSMSEEDIEKAWTYWESLGVVKKHYGKNGDREQYTVEFLCLKENLYGKIPDEKTTPFNDEERKERILIDNQALKQMYRTIEGTIGRPISGTETEEILSWMDDYGATDEAIAYAYSYAMMKKKDNVKYVGAIVKSWCSKGLMNVLEIDDYLKESDQRHYTYKRIMKALGFVRNATEEEKNKIDKWIDSMDFSIDKILEACKKTSGIPNPNINYVNQVLINWHKEAEAPIAVGTVQKYYEKIRRQAEEQAAENCRQVYEAVPRIKQIDERMRECSMEISRTMISDSADKLQEMKKYKDEAKELDREKAILLTENNYPLDYMEIKYMCSLCKDTGTKDNGVQCECFLKRSKEAEEWRNSLKES